MNLEENKKNVIAFKETAYEGNPKDAIQQIPPESANPNTMY